MKEGNKVIGIVAIALLSGVNGQSSAPTCPSTSQDCCWVVQIWTLMGQTTMIDPASSNACCSMAGVSCSTTGAVTSINWSTKALKGNIPDSIGNLVSLQSLSLGDNQLSGSIPSSVGDLVNLSYIVLNFNELTGPLPNFTKLTKLTKFSAYNNKLNGSIPTSIANSVLLESLLIKNNQLSGAIPRGIGKLVKLVYLYLDSNRLDGSIPAEIGNLNKLTQLGLASNLFTGVIPSNVVNLANLQIIYLTRNRNLTGTFSFRCRTEVWIPDTNVTLCGCSSKISPATLFPPPTTPLTCLGSSSGPVLSKRAQIVIGSIASQGFTCNTDNNLNPYQDCLNSMAAYCNPASYGNVWNATTIEKCKSVVDIVSNSLNSLWKRVRESCGGWSYNNVVGSATSTQCTDANKALVANAFYVSSLGLKSPVTLSLTDSVNQMLWKNPSIR